MPLRATVDGADVIAPLLSDEEWSALAERARTRQLTIELPCCRARGYPRVSKLGTRHFVHHRRADCDWKPESPLHLKAKAEIARAVASAGYEAVTEDIGPDWKADVMAKKGTVRVAFEVQLSKQSLEETKERQARYARDGIRGCWFFLRPPRRACPDRDLPLFELSDRLLVEPSDGTPEPQPTPKTLKNVQLADFVAALLTRRIRFCNLLTRATRQRIAVGLLPRTCRQCGTTNNLHFPLGSWRSACDIEWNEGPGPFHPKVLEALKLFRDTTEGQSYAIAEANRSGYRCYKCRAHINPDFAYEDWETEMEIRENGLPILPLTFEVTRRRLMEHCHWCYPQDGVFCDEAAGPQVSTDED